MLEKQKLFITVIVVLTFQSCGIFNFFDRKDHEVKESYYPDGSLEYKSTYFNDKLDGPTWYYSPKGILVTYAEYVNGSMHGISKSFYETNELKYICNYFHGHKHGDEKFYYKNGQIQSLVKYEYGKEIKEIIRWNEKGELLY